MQIETVVINWDKSVEQKRLHDILDNEAAKRAVEIALAGSHELVILSSIRAPASELLRAAANIAKKHDIPFKGKVIPVCLCGALGSPKEECTCTDDELKAYNKKVIPMMRTAAMVIEAVEPRATATTKRNEHEDTIVARILAARKQEGALPMRTNSGASDLMRMAVIELKADPEKIAAVAQTIARMNNSQYIGHEHVAEAAMYQHKRANKWTDPIEEV
jgi:predicted ATPase with chaperone activity